MYSSINIVIFCLMCKPQLYTCITKLSDMEKRLTFKSIEVQCILLTILYNSSI